MAGRLGPHHKVRGPRAVLGQVREQDSEQNESGVVQHIQHSFQKTFLDPAPADSPAVGLPDEGARAYRHLGASGMPWVNFSSAVNSCLLKRSKVSHVPASERCGNLIDHQKRVISVLACDKKSTSPFYNFHIRKLKACEVRKVCGQQTMKLQEFSRQIPRLHKPRLLGWGPCCSTRQCRNRLVDSDINMFAEITLEEKRTSVCSGVARNHT